MTHTDPTSPSQVNLQDRSNSMPTPLRLSDKQILYWLQNTRCSVRPKSGRQFGFHIYYGKTKICSNRLSIRKAVCQAAAIFEENKK